MGSYKDLTGCRFGNLEVLYRDPEDYVSPKGYKAVQWICRCDCGNVVSVRGCNLKSGASTSCGCKRVDFPNRKTHGMSHTRLHNIWCGMKTRCYNDKDESYYCYGAKGIKMCDEWKDDFVKFKDWAINNGYQDNLSIDRVDFSGDYEPNNCRWTDAKTQANNTSRNHYLTYNGKTQTIAEWSDETNIKYAKIKDRINKCGWSVEKALSTK